MVLLDKGLGKLRKLSTKPLVINKGPSLINHMCQAEKCGVDLSEAKKYLRRYKVCEAHFNAPTVVVAGIRQRFCRQCSRFHELSEFDDMKRSCRRSLAGHNGRRRRSSSESQGSAGRLTKAEEP